MNDLAKLDATVQAELVRSKQVTPLELVDAAIGRIEKVNPRVNAVIIPLFEKARAQAKRGDIPDGPFHGVPLLIKDLILATAGDPLHLGTSVLRKAGYVAPADTYLAQKFRAAGFIFLGKTNTPELGMNPTTEPVAYGPTRNPWNPGHSVGGSSGGSGAAVASGMVPVAYGNDGAGSIRIPSSECGVFGLKPSRGRLSLGPNLGEMWHGLVTEGVLSRTVRDTAAVLDAIAGDMPGDPYTAPPKLGAYLDEVGRSPGKLRIGFMKSSPQSVSEVHPECRSAVEDVARLLESLGHHVEQAYPAALDEPERGVHIGNVVPSHTATLIDQVAQLAGRKLESQDMEYFTWMFSEIGRGTSVEQYINSVDWLREWSRRMAQWWHGGFDLLLTPTLFRPPPKLGTLTPTAGDMEAVRRLVELLQFTQPFNVTGQPAMSVPLAWSAAGLPIGAQFVAAMGREDLLIRLASQLEQARPWKDRLPGIHVDN